MIIKNKIYFVPILVIWIRVFQIIVFYFIKLFLLVFVCYLVYFLFSTNQEVAEITFKEMSTY